MAAVSCLPDELLAAVFARCPGVAQLCCIPHVCKRWGRVSASSVRVVDLTGPGWTILGVCTITPTAYRRLVTTFPNATTVRVHRAALLNAVDLGVTVSPNVTELSLAGCPAINDRVIGLIAVGCPNLAAINIDHATNVTLAAFAWLCSRCVLLANVSIADCLQLTRGALATLAACPRLTRLCVDGDALGRDRVHTLATLTHLTINGDSAAMNQADNPATVGLPALTHLRAPNSVWHPFGLVTANNVGLCKSIVEVDVRSDFAVSTKCLLAMLLQCDTLRHLAACVGSTCLAQHHEREIAEGMSSGLTHLTCSGLTDDTLALLAIACPHLTHVDIAGSCVRTAAVLARPPLRFLCLDNTLVGDDTILALAQHATSLETVLCRSPHVYVSNRAFAALLDKPSLRALKFTITANTATLQWAIARARARRVHVDRHWTQ